jgi:xanthine dehydrogenase accessory factor
MAAARAILTAGAGPSVRRVALGPSLGQCCGGAVVLLFEPTVAWAWPGVVATKVRAGRTCVIATVVESARTTGVPLGAKLIVTGRSVTGDWGARALAAGAVRAARGHLTAPGTRTSTAVVLGHTLLLDRVAPELDVRVFGAGHVGQALVAILATLPCAVTWVDARPEQYPAVLPRNVRAEPTDEPESQVEAAPCGACFVVMTHSHPSDLAIVERVLRRGDFAYLGLIGSGSKPRRFEQRLRLRGLAPATIARLRCPIGLADVPGKHPGAIAVATAAELLRVCGGR